MNAGFWRLSVYPSLESTSDLLIRLASEGEPEGRAVMALRQTAGRGSRGRGWESPPGGNLYLSVLLRPSGTLDQAGRWALVTAVALAEALESLLPGLAALHLKWPNDVLLAGRKLAGILLDASAQPSGRIDWLVIGCGVNLAHAPVLPGRRAACVAEVSPPPAPEAMAEALLAHLFDWRMRLTSDGFAPVRAAWLKRAQPVGTEIQLAYNGILIVGTFAGLAEDGSLLLSTGGRVAAYATGEVLMPNPPGETVE